MKHLILRKSLLAHMYLRLAVGRTTQLVWIDSSVKRCLVNLKSADCLKGIARCLLRKMDFLNVLKEVCLIARNHPQFPLGNLPGHFLKTPFDIRILNNEKLKERAYYVKQ